MRALRLILAPALGALLLACGNADGPVRVRVVDPAGAPLAGVRAGCREADGSIWIMPGCGADGVIAISAAEETEVAFLHRGSRVVKATYPGGPEDVVLRPGIRCVLCLPEDLPLPEPPVRFAVQFRRGISERDDDLMLATDYADPPADLEDPAYPMGSLKWPEGERRLVILLPAPGEVLLQVAVARDVRDSTGVRNQLQRGCAQFPVVVEDREGEQVIEVPVASEDLEAALEALGE